MRRGKANRRREEIGDGSKREEEDDEDEERLRLRTVNNVRRVAEDAIVESSRVFGDLGF